MKKLLGIVLIIAMCLSVAACGATSATTTAKQTDPAATTVAAEGVTFKSQPAFVGDESEVYHFVTFAGGVDYWSSLYEGFKDAARELGVKSVYSATTDADINNEVALFNDVLTTSPSGIFLCPFNGEPFTDSLKKAKSQGIPVSLYTNPPSDSSLYLTMIDHDNVRDSGVAAEYVGSKLGGKGTVAIEETEGQANHIARVNAFVDYLAVHYPDVKVVAKAPTNHSAELGAQAARDFILAYPDLDYIFCVSSNCALGAATAIQEAKADTKIVTFDSDPGVLEALKSGLVEAAFQPDAYMFGYMGMLSMYIEKHKLMDPMTDQASKGEYMFGGQIIFPNCRVVTKENADQFNSTNYLARRESKGYEESSLDMKSTSLPGYWER